jgi:hypothetical protein
MRYILIISFSAEKGIPLSAYKKELMKTFKAIGCKVEKIEGKTI